MTAPPGELPWDQRLGMSRQVSGALLEQASGLRGFPLPDESAALPAVHRALVEVRARLDQLETVHGQALTLKAAAEAAALGEERAEQDAWDDEAERYQKRGLRQDYEGAQERYAVFRIRTRDVRARARAARDIADLAAFTERRISAMHRGLDGARLDLHRRLNVVAVIESSMERT